MKKYLFNSVSRLLGYISLLLLSGLCYAGTPLSISVASGTTLPTQVPVGGVVNAFYTVQNNTVSVRSNNFVKWLPVNVTQVTNDSRYCGATFTLQPVNSANSSCTLKLAINGATSPGPTPSSNLLVCFPGGKICGGPPPGSQLNVVAVSGVVNSVFSGKYQTTATGNPTVHWVVGTQDGGATWKTLLSSANVGSGLPNDILLTNAAGTGNQGIQQIKCTSSSCVIGSAYATNVSPFGYYLFIAYSPDKGLTWKSVGDSTHLSGFPSDISPAINSHESNYYASGACNGMTCILGGQYCKSIAANPPQFPVLSVSQDGGATWTSKVDDTTGNLPSDIAPSSAPYTAFFYNVYYAAACSSSVCLAAGTYSTSTSNAGGPHWPVVTVSQDGGNTWTTTLGSPTATPANAGALPSDYLSTSSNVVLKIPAASCQGNSCFIAGRYESNNNRVYPLIVASNDKGTTWKTVVSKSSIGSALPSDLVGTTPLNNNIFDAVSLYSSSCSGSTCVAGGTYQVPVSGGVMNYPMILTSHDGGQTWLPTLSSSSVGGSLPSDFATLPNNNNNLNRIYTVSCSSGNICVAGGSYQAGTGQFVFPLLLVSYDGGDTWATKISSSSVGRALPSDLYTQTKTLANVIYSAACSGSYCEVGGQYFTSSLSSAFVPFIAVSQDGGVTWSSVLSSATASSLPSDFLKGQIGAAPFNDGAAIPPSASLVDKLSQATQSPFDKETMLKALIKA